jgi:hypothetical protein
LRIWRPIDKGRQQALESVQADFHCWPIRQGITTLP